ncbi:MAG: hydrogenase iron-sulfur subunit [Verrucomicrobia bacterium]|nr:hydrogenase iron-sulfur subunit [Verrucomicrobiota bacterium]
MSSDYQPRILVLATLACAYPGADAVGQAHLEYPSNINILRVPAPVVFPEDFYLHSFAKGVDGILVTGCGTDCPFEGVYPKLSRRIDRIVQRMKAGGLEIERLRLTAICTVCIKAFLKEVNQMNDKLRALGPVKTEAAAALWRQSLADLRVAAGLPAQAS